MIIIQRPYRGKSRKEIRENIINHQISLKKSDVPSNWSNQAADFITKCLQRKPQNRLGANGPNEVTQHCWLKGYDWDRIKAKSLVAPFIPVLFNLGHRRQL